MVLGVTDVQLTGTKYDVEQTDEARGDQRGWSLLYILPKLSASEQSRGSSLYLNLPALEIPSDASGRQSKQENCRLKARRKRSSLHQRFIHDVQSS